MLLSPAGSDALAEAKLDLDLLEPAVACKRFHCSMSEIFVFVLAKQKW